jgi:AraC family transcriptional regulator
VRAQTRNAYLRRINVVIDYIYTHIAEDLPLERLARVAAFSPYHFHRLFRAQVGENLNAFVRRVRVARAVALMKASPDAPLTRIALEAGFSSSSDFSRTFRQHFGIPPSRWDRSSPLEDSKIWQAHPDWPRYRLEQLAEVDDRGEFEIEIRPFPATRIAFVRVTNAYDLETMLRGYRRLIAWLEERFGGLPPGIMIGTSQDDPDVTPAEQCRYDFCYTVDGTVEPEGDIGVRTLPACTLACAHCDGDGYRLVRVWDWLYRYWLPRSRYQPANVPALEIYRRTPEEVGWEWFDLDACIPVERL